MRMRKGIKRLRARKQLDPRPPAGVRESEPAYYVTRIGRQQIVSARLAAADPWTQLTYALLDACQAALGDAAVGPAFVLLASDLLQAQYGPDACWSRLDVERCARAAARAFPRPGIARRCTEELATFLDFLEASGRLAPAPLPALAPA